MTYHLILAATLEDAGESIFRAARATPTERLTWKPAPTARTALELLQEIVQTTGWVTQMICQGGLTMPDDAEKKAADERAQWGSVDALEAEFRRRAPKLVDAVRGFPEEKLSQLVKLPWGEMTWLAAIDYAVWNIRYHDGQLQYIQTMYGDKEIR
jgi:hypothetical protein